MTVGELIRELQDCSPDVRVIINVPFGTCGECYISQVTYDADFEEVVTIDIQEL